MRIRVLFFGQLKDITRTPEAEEQVDSGATPGSLFERYCGQYPGLAGLRGSVVAARNRQFTDFSQPLADGDEVAFLPPVSGG